MNTNNEGLDEILDELDVEVPTAAYEVWAKEENEEDKMEIFRNLPKVATVHNELYRDNDVEEALKEAVQQAWQRELRRILERIEFLGYFEFEDKRKEFNKGYRKALEELEEEVEGLLPIETRGGKN